MFWHQVVEEIDRVDDVSAFIVKDLLDDPFLAVAIEVIEVIRFVYVIGFSKEQTIHQLVLQFRVPSSFQFHPLLIEKLTILFDRLSTS